uniref:GPCR family 2 latrophilin C-terminal domain-containing protein n=1 Tax=Gadus morhua TaxID=8049 RepID=A0A8C5FB85_GADMO
MDTLPLNGNHGNSYSIASAEYMSDCVQIIDRGFNHKETTLEKKILKELTVSNGGKDSGYGMGLGMGMAMNMALGLDDHHHATFGPHRDEGLGLELIREESVVPLLPQRPPLMLPPPLQPSESLHNHLHPDSLYTSMPVLAASAASADGPKDAGDSKSQEAGSDDVYYKSMPNLGSRNHLHQLHSYYQLGRGSSEGFIVSPNKEDLAPGEPEREPSHLVTSL